LTLIPKVPDPVPEGSTCRWYVTVAGRFVDGNVIVAPQDVTDATCADVSPRMRVSVAHVFPGVLGVVTGAVMV